MLSVDWSITINAARGLIRHDDVQPEGWAAVPKTFFSLIRQEGKGAL